MIKTMHPEAGTISRRALLQAGGCLLAGVLPAAANAADPVAVLHQFLHDVQSLRAQFTQVVVAPKGDRKRTSSGSFELARPNRFRFDYGKPYEQLIVSDGKTLWLYDADLNQVTARPYAAAVGSTPAALLAGGSDAALERDFKLEGVPDRDGLQWVKATPRSSEGQIHSAQVGFRSGTLAALDIVDSFGQRSTLTFSQVEVNPKLPESRFAFKPPAGTDVIGD